MVNITLTTVNDKAVPYELVPEVNELKEFLIEKYLFKSCDHKNLLEMQHYVDLFNKYIKEKYPQTDFSMKMEYGSPSSEEYEWDEQYRKWKFWLKQYLEE